MKKTILSVFLFLIVIHTANSQNQATVEKSITSLQIGILGVYVNNEFAVSKQIVLTTEIGLNGSIFGGFSYDKTGIVLAPSITVEPKWYYNLEKRKEKGKTHTNNNGNFFSLKNSFSPNWFVISNYDNIQTVPQFTVIPSWGIRRNISSKLMYEISGGIGYRYINYKSIGYTKNKNETFPNFHLRIGYLF